MFFDNWTFVITLLNENEYFIIDNQKGGKIMYNYMGGSMGGSCGCSNMGYTPYYQPNYGYSYGGCCHNNSNYAIVLVLFILLVIVIGSRFNHC